MSDRLVFRFSTSEDTLANYASAAIRRLNHSPFSHVDIVLPDGNLLGASDQGPDSPVVEFYPRSNTRGVAVRPPNYQRFGIRRDMILQTDRADAIIAKAMSQLGRPFDSTALWGFLSDDHPGVRDWRDPEKWFCSELAVWSCEAGGLYDPLTLLAIPKNRVSPPDFLLIHVTDPRWINRDTFWDPIPGLTLDPGER